MASEWSLSGKRDRHGYDGGKGIAGSKTSTSEHRDWKPCRRWEADGWNACVTHVRGGAGLWEVLCVKIEVGPSLEGDEEPWREGV